MARSVVPLERPAQTRAGSLKLKTTTWAKLERYREWRSLNDEVDYDLEHVIEGFSKLLDREEEFVTFSKSRDADEREKRKAEAFVSNTNTEKPETVAPKKKEQISATASNNLDGKDEAPGER
jgi:hypothetical protein